MGIWTNGPTVDAWMAAQNVLSLAAPPSDWGQQPDRSTHLNQCVPPRELPRWHYQRVLSTNAS